MNLRRLLPLLCVALLLPAAARAATLNVPSQYPTIQAGVNAAVSGDTVLVADGTYSGDGNRDIDFGGKNLTVTSQHGAASAIIDCGGYATTDGSGNHRGFYIHTGEMAGTISGFTIKNGYQAELSSVLNSGRGGGIDFVNHDRCSFAIKKCIITQCTASYWGGGIAVENGAGIITLSECTLSSNNAYYGGGAEIVNSNGTSEIEMTGCMVLGNTANYGAGIYSFNNGFTDIILINSTVSGNVAQFNGGGLYNANNGDLISGTNLTISGNTALAAGGGTYNDNFNNSSAILLTNCISYKNTGGEILDRPASHNVTVVTYCDIEGGYPGMGNIDADPLFVNAAYGNFHLQPGSPCLGAGTSTGAPATDKDGRTRPDPPSIGAYEVVSSSAAHILWNYTDATASLWTVASDSSVMFKNYGPYPGWVATALADTPDGKTHLLWNHASNGQVSVWDVDTQNTITFKNYGPFTGWAAAGMSAGPDGRLHLLWNHQPDGQMSLWSLDSGAGTYTHQEYGPFAGWSAKLIATGGDGATDVVWASTSGQVSSWRVSSADGSYAHHEYGPYPGWTVNALAAGPDGQASLVWANTNGTQSLWSADFGAGSFTFTNYGPYAGWAAVGVAVGSDGVRRLLWDHGADGQASLWTVDGSGGFAAKNYGPFAGWSAVSLSAGQ